MNGPVDVLAALAELQACGLAQHSGAVRRAVAHLRAALAASPQVEPEVTDVMVVAYLQANHAYWKRIDDEPQKLGVWRNGTPAEATKFGLAAALAAAPRRTA